VVWGAYVLAPLRERLNLREFAGDDQFVWVNGYAIHYTDDGPREAPAVVLIHGFASSIFTWRHTKAALLAAGYRVIAVDQLGSGASARPAEPIYTTQTQAEMVVGVLDALGVRRAHFVGHSFGGRVAMQIALLAPERVQSLVAIAPEAFATARPAIARWVRLPIAGYILAFYSTSPLLVRPGLQFVSSGKAWITNEVVKGYAAPLYVRGSALAQVWQARSPKDGQKPVPHNLNAITPPTLLLWGEKDPIFPADDGVKLARILPAATLHLFENTGHIVHEERVEQTNHAILEFLKLITHSAAAQPDLSLPKHYKATGSGNVTDG
jgi:pimeloyl-ACP methyl ester carboxylesterase